MRPVYRARDPYPRYVGNRSKVYLPVHGQVPSEPLGYIPEVLQTYSYWEAMYGYANEHGLTLGESTSAGKFVHLAGPNLLCIRELTLLAMERCKTARCAVQTMGRLAEEHGFYGEDPGESGAGESLGLADGAEGWIFHITGTPGGRGATWVARRVPNGHVALVANAFVIQEVDCADEANYFCSTGLLATAREAGVWDGRSAFNWAKAMGQDLLQYSYFQGFPPIPWYTSARLWRIFSRVAPSLGVQLVMDNLAYPFSVRAERNLTARDVMDLQRDHYEGTELDLTIGAFAGPFGSPNRVELGRGMQVVKGQFARAISIPRAAYAVVGQTWLGSDTGRSTGLSKLWLGSDAPASSVFVPFYMNTSRFAAPYRTGHMAEFDDQSAWWVFDFLANWMDLNHRLMRVDVEKKIAELQDAIDAERVEKERSAALQLRKGDREVAFELLGEFQEGVQGRVVSIWRKFGHFMIAKYNDGYLNFGTTNDEFQPGTYYGYPAWWLEMNGFDDDPRPKWAQPSSKAPELYNIMGPSPFAKIPAALQKEAASWEGSSVETLTPALLRKAALDSKAVDLGERAATSSLAVGAGLAVLGGTPLALLFGAAFFATGFVVGRRTSGAQGGNNVEAVYTLAPA